MKILKVIVDELPSGCRDCDYMAYDDAGYDVCILTDEPIYYSDEPRRVKHCPLTVEVTKNNTF